MTVYCRHGSAKEGRTVEAPRECAGVLGGKTNTSSVRNPKMGVLDMTILRVVALVEGRMDFNQFHACEVC